MLAENTPKITLAQKIGVAVTGVPVISNLLLAFGVYAVSPEQQHALTETLTWAAGASAVLFVADAAIRIGRAHAVGKIQSAETNLTAAAVAEGVTPAGVPSENTPERDFFGSGATPDAPPEGE